MKINSPTAVILASPIFALLVGMGTYNFGHDKGQKEISAILEKYKKLSEDEKKQLKESIQFLEQDNKLLGSKLDGLHRTNEKLAKSSEAIKVGYEEKVSQLQRKYAESSSQFSSIIANRDRLLTELKATISSASNNAEKIEAQNQYDGLKCLSIPVPDSVVDVLNMH